MSSRFGEEFLVRPASSAGARKVAFDGEPGEEPVKKMSMALIKTACCKRVAIALRT
jgi:hypothetical protein